MKELATTALFYLLIFCALLWSVASGASEANGTVESLHHGRNLKARKPAAASAKKCTNKEWCSVAAPNKSLFRFTTPIDPNGWKEAQMKAASGEQVLLAKIMKHFPTYLDFLDGDTKFRKFHHIADFFVDRNRDLSPLLANEPKKWKLKQAKEPYKWGNAKVLPRDHDVYTNKRAPIFKLGYYAFQTAGSLWFGGVELGKALVSRTLFTEYWQKVKQEVKRPFILLDVHDENWGLLSTHFPNRTAKWGECCGPEELSSMLDFLDHNQTLMALVNQHTNITHPKIITLPRGLPMQSDHAARLIWDTMHSALQTALPKNKFVFTASSDTTSRHEIMPCIGRKFKSDQFTWQVSTSPGEFERQRKMGELAYNKDYYTKLITTRVGIAPPGVGYDTFRLWELLTVGAVAVIERGVGLDKTVWRLPVLLVDDFAEITDSLLRTAYVEAVYRATTGEFEFERLTQSFWFSFIMRVSRAQSVDAVLEKFPLEAEDASFTRPAVPFVCTSKKDGKNMCGEGTKRTPRVSC